MRRNVLLVVILAVLLGAAPLLAQTTVTEANLFGLIKSNAPEPLIIRAISMAKVIDVDTSLEGAVSLMSKGVSEKVVKALVDRKEQLSSGPAPISTSASAISPAVSGATIPEEAGVFVENSTDLTPLPLEKVSSQKTPGAFQAMKMGASLGFSRMKSSSTLSGMKSSAQLPGPIVVLVRCVDGISADDYKLIALEPNKKSGNREFVTSSAGMMGSSTDENTIPVTFQKVGPNTYKTTLTNLKGGEYGFLSSSSGQKLYTFGVY